MFSSLLCQQLTAILGLCRKRIIIPGNSRNPMISISLAVWLYSDQYHQTSFYIGAHFCSYRCVTININKHTHITTTLINYYPVNTISFHTSADQEITHSKFPFAKHEPFLLCKALSDLNTVCHLFGPCAKMKISPQNCAV